MTPLARGQRVPLLPLLATRGAGAGDPAASLEVAVGVRVPGAEVDVACFAVDGQGHLADDRYFVFYNQPSSPDGAIALTAEGGTPGFRLHLAGLPAWVERVVLTASLDGAATMGALAHGHVVLGDAELTLDPAWFTTEKAVVLVELYRRSGEWRLAAVAQGFAGGLAALLAHLGGEALDEGPAEDGPVRDGSVGGGLDGGLGGGVGGGLGGAAIDLRMAQRAPHLVSLAKTATVSLEKQGLAGHRARVALCLDISKSMRRQYERGAVQRFAERVLALATRLDDDGAIDVFLFAGKAYAFGPLSLANWEGFTDELLAAHPLEGGTRYGAVMELVRTEMLGGAVDRSDPSQQVVAPAELPLYVMVLTDGQTGTKQQAIDQLVWSSFEPVFWQFLGLGRGGRGDTTSAGFGFLQQMDELPGRFLDNAGFFGVADLDALGDDELYDQMMGEYPGWVPQARTKGLIP